MIFSPSVTRGRNAFLFLRQKLKLVIYFHLSTNTSTIRILRRGVSRTINIYIFRANLNTQEHIGGLFVCLFVFLKYCQKLKMAIHSLQPPYHQRRKKIQFKYNENKNKNKNINEVLVLGISAEAPFPYVTWLS